VLIVCYDRLRPPVANDPPVIRARRNNRYRVCPEVPGICYRSAARPWSGTCGYTSCGTLIGGGGGGGCGEQLFGGFKNYCNASGTL